MQLPILVISTVTYLLSCAVSKLRSIIGQIFAIDRGTCLTFTPPLGWSRINFRPTSPEIREIVPPDAENRTIVSSFVWTWRSDGRTDGRTDRRDPSSYYSALHCEEKHKTQRSTGSQVKEIERSLYK